MKPFLDRARPHKAKWSHLCCFCVHTIPKDSLYLRDGDACAHIECAERRAGRRWGEDPNQMTILEMEESNDSK